MVSVSCAKDDIDIRRQQMKKYRRTIHKHFMA